MEALFLSLPLPSLFRRFDINLEHGKGRKEKEKKEEEEEQTINEEREVKQCEKGGEKEENGRRRYGGSKEDPIFLEKKGTLRGVGGEQVPYRQIGKKKIYHNNKKERIGK